MSKYEKFKTCVFIPRSFEWIDPQKEMSASISGLKAGVISLSDVVSKYGKDVESHLEQLQTEKKLADDFNIKYTFEPYGDGKGGNNDVSMQEDQTNNEEDS